MNEGDLLLRFRLILREEVATFAAQMDARFDHVFNSLEGLIVRLDRLSSEFQPTTCAEAHDSVASRYGETTTKSN
jgi:hypothetical protein